MPDSATQTDTRPHVVVVGGGFGGIAAVRKLKRANVRVTLVDRHTYNTFQPLLYQVATASLNAGDITWFLRAVRDKQDNVRFVKGAVVQIDHEARSMTMDTGAVITYDYAILATGVTTNYFGVPGAQEHAMALYKRSQALAVRDRIFANLEDAAINGQDRDLRVVVVGGGATGTEVAGALAEMRNNDMPVTYPELDTSRTHITLIEQAPYVLAPFAPKLRDYARKSLEKRDVDVRLNTPVKEVRADGVVIGDDEFLAAGITIWATGVTAHPVVKDWNVPQGRGGRIRTGYDLRVEGSDRVFAVGDLAVTPDPLPQLAQPALQGGKHAAKTIRRLIEGKEAKPFKYSDKGTMATIGRYSAVAEITFAPKMKGLLAWLIWVAIHVVQLLGNRNRLATLINLTAKYAGPRTHSAIVGETPLLELRQPVPANTLPEFVETGPRRAEPGDQPASGDTPGEEAAREDEAGAAGDAATAEPTRTG